MELLKKKVDLQKCMSMSDFAKIKGVKYQAIQYKIKTDQLDWVKDGVIKVVLNNKAFVYEPNRNKRRFVPSSE